MGGKGIWYTGRKTEYKWLSCLKEKRNPNTNVFLFKYSRRLYHVYRVIFDTSDLQIIQFLSFKYLLSTSDVPGTLLNMVNTLGKITPCPQGLYFGAEEQWLREARLAKVAWLLMSSPGHLRNFNAFPGWAESKARFIWLIFQPVNEILSRTVISWSPNISSKIKFEEGLDPRPLFKRPSPSLTFWGRRGVYLLENFCKIIASEENISSSLRKLSFCSSFSFSLPWGPPPTSVPLHSVC